MNKAMVRFVTILLDLFQEIVFDTKWIHTYVCMHASMRACVNACMYCKIKVVLQN